MHLGLHVTTFNPAGGTPAIRAGLKDIAQFTDENGFYSLNPMDHFFQIGHHGPPEDPMLEAYTTLGYFAGLTEKIKLLAVVTEPAVGAGGEAGAKAGSGDGSAVG